MSGKGDDDRFAARFRRLVDSRTHDLLMAQMHAVKGPQRDDGASAIRYFLKGMEYLHRIITSQYVSKHLMRTYDMMFFIEMSNAGQFSLRRIDPQHITMGQSLAGKGHCAALQKAGVLFRRTNRLGKILNSHVGRQDIRLRIGF